MMTALRLLILRYRALAVAVLVMALAMKALVPTGMMLGTDAGRGVTIRLCDGVADSARAVTLTIGHGGPDQHDGGKQAPDHQACPYTALAHHALGGADPILLALALAFIVMLGFRALSPPALRRAARWLPPAHAPPLSN